jgi:hypothetical protein
MVILWLQTALQDRILILNVSSNRCRILTGLLFVRVANHQIFDGSSATILRHGSTFLMDRGRDVPGVKPDAVVGEHVEFPLHQSHHEASPAVAAAQQTGEFPNPTVTVQIQLVAAIHTGGTRVTISLLCTHR